MTKICASRRSIISPRICRKGEMLEKWNEGGKGEKSFFNLACINRISWNVNKNTSRVFTLRVTFLNADVLFKISASFVFIFASFHPHWYVYPSSPVPPSILFSATLHKFFFPKSKKKEKKFNRGKLQNRTATSLRKQSSPF